MKTANREWVVSRMRKARQRGFTLIELMIVIFIVLILVSIAIPNYQRSVLHAREAVLRNDLFVLRSAIDQYTLDKQKAPQTLDDIISAGYLKVLPPDPITKADNCWVPVSEDSLFAVDQTQPGIIDVHSCNESTSLDGTTYSSW